MMFDQSRAIVYNRNSFNGPDRLFQRNQVIQNAKTDLSTKNSSPRTRAWLSAANVNRRWTESTQSTQVKGTLSPDRGYEQPCKKDQLAWVNRNFRLTQATDFKRVRRSGRSYAHPFIVLVALPAKGEQTRIGISAGKSVGGAVQRNRAKRLAREAIRPLLPELHNGWKIVMICRSPILKANFLDIQACLLEMFTKARILKDRNER